MDSCSPEALTRIPIGICSALNGVPASCVAVTTYVDAFSSGMAEVAPMMPSIEDLSISAVGEKLQFRVNAKQGATRWRRRTEIADEPLPGAKLDMTDAA